MKRISFKRTELTPVRTASYNLQPSLFATEFHISQATTVIKPPSPITRWSNYQTLKLPVPRITIKA